MTTIVRRERESSVEAAVVRQARVDLGLVGLKLTPLGRRSTPCGCCGC